MREIVVLIVFTLLVTFNSYSQKDSISYSFFIAGHVSGRTGNNNIIGIHPAFKEKFEYIQNRTEIKFGVFTGDIVSPHPVEQDWDEVDDDVNLLGLPVYFAVGNHDMENRPLYESRYGITYYHFIYSNDLFIILDPNIDGWSITGEQLDFLVDVVDSNYESVDNIFVFFHQLLWKPGNSTYSAVKINSYAGIVPPINFSSEIEPIFKSLNKPVVFFAGDLGAGSWSSDFMYDSYDNISLVASGMGEGVGDNFIIANIFEDKSISYDLICLNDTVLNCFGELKDYQISPNSVDETEIENFKIYPNPAKQNIQIQKIGNFNLYTKLSVIIINNQGIITDEFLMNQNEINMDISSYTAGLYFILIKNNRGAILQMQRIIIE